LNTVNVVKVVLALVSINASNLGMNAAMPQQSSTQRPNNVTSHHAQLVNKDAQTTTNALSAAVTPRNAMVNVSPQTPSVAQLVTPFAVTLAPHLASVAQMVTHHPLMDIVTHAPTSQAPTNALMAPAQTAVPHQLNAHS
jgi:hypothetical protein